MLNNVKVTLEAKTHVGEDVIAKHMAVLEGEDLEANFYPQMQDKDACKENRELIRKERAEFEDMVYEVQDLLRSK